MEDAERTLLCRISVCGSCVCGWNSHQSEYKPAAIPEAAKRYHTQMREKIKAALYGKDDGGTRKPLSVLSGGIDRSKRCPASAGG